MEGLSIYRPDVIHGFITGNDEEIFLNG
jgi:hypothetical protein